MNLARAILAGGLIEKAARTKQPEGMGPSQPLDMNLPSGRPLVKVDFDPTTAIVKGYKASAWVFACINRIATAASTVPWRVYKRTPDDWEPLDSHPLEDMMETPNQKMTRQSLMYFEVAWLLAVGNCLFRVNRLNDQKKTPVELWPFAPRNVFPIPDDKDWILGYQYTEDGVRKRTDEEGIELIHAMIPDPDNILWGAGPLQSVWKTVTADVAGTEWRADLLGKGGVPPGAIIDDSIQTEEQLKMGKERLRAAWRDAASNVSPMLLTGGKNWMNFSINASDMQYLEGRQFSVQEIVAAFGLLPAMFDPGAATYDNLTASIRWMYDNPVTQALDLIEGALNLKLIPEKEQASLWLHYDFSGVKAVQDDVARKVAAVAQALSTGISPNEAYRLFDIAINADEEGDTRFLSSGLVRLKDAAADASTQEPTGMPPGPTPPQFGQPPGAPPQTEGEERQPEDKDTKKPPPPEEPEDTEE